MVNMSTTYKEYRTENDEPILVEAARRDGDGKNIKNNYAKQTGYYGAMGAGHADSAKSLDTEVGNEDQTPFGFATVGIDSDVETGIQELRKLVGCKIARNQLVKNPRFADGTTGWSGSNCTIAVVNGVLEATLTSSEGTANVHTFDNHWFLGNHWYFFHCRVKVSSPDVNIQVSVPLTDTEPSTNSTDWVDLFYVSKRSNDLAAGLPQVHCSSPVAGEKFYIQLITMIDFTIAVGDFNYATAIIGNGDMASRVANVINFFNGNLPENFDEGSLSSCKSAKLKTVDYNQLNPANVVKNKVLNVYGQVGSETGGCYVMIDAKPNTLYEWIDEHSGSALQSVMPEFFDADGNFIKREGNGPYATRQFTTPKNCVKIGLTCWANGGDNSGYFDDKFCLFIYWDGSRIGYEPYAEHIIDLPNKDLNGVVKLVNGELVADGDEIYPDGEGNIKRYQKVVYDGTQDCTFGIVGAFSRLSFSMPVQGVAYSRAICNRLIRDVNYSKETEHFYVSSTAVQVFLRSAIAGSTKTDCLAWLAEHPVEIIYEINPSAQEPIEASNYPSNFYGDDFGTMQFLDENNEPINGLQGCEMFYKANVAGFAESLYVKTGGDPDDLVSQDELEAVDNKIDPVIENLGGILRHMVAEKYTVSFDDTTYIDLGSITWYYNEPYAIFHADPRIPQETNTTKYVCSKYKTVESINNMADKSITGQGGAGSAIWIKDSSFGNDTVALKAALKGILLAYKKAA